MCLIGKLNESTLKQLWENLSLCDLNIMFTT